MTHDSGTGAVVDLGMMGLQELGEPGPRPGVPGRWKPLVPAESVLQSSGLIRSVRPFRGVGDGLLGRPRRATTFKMVILGFCVIWQRRWHAFRAGNLRRIS